MRLPRLLLVLPFAMAVAIPATANTPLVTSNFDSGVDGWSSVTLPYPSAVPPTITFTFAPQVTAGRLWLTDPDGTNPTGDAQYWRAPAKFLGDQSAAGVLRCDLADTYGGGYGPFVQEDLLLLGGGLTLCYRFGTSTPDGSTLATMTTDLYGGGGRVGGLSGPFATREQIGTVLSSLTDVFIRAEYQLGPDTQYLDNVALLTPNVAVEDAIAPRILSLARPTPNPSSGAMRVSFTLPAGGSVSLGVLDASGRRIATIVDGSLPAGAHTTTWNGRDASGRPASAGLYWLELTHGGRRVTQRVVRM